MTGFKELLQTMKGGSAEPAIVAGSDGQDRRIARKPLWRRYGLLAVAVLVMAGGAAWLLSRGGGNVYRAPLSQLTIGTVTQGPFEDYIAVRGAVAPLVTAYLTTEQGGTVKLLLAEDGATVKQGQPLIVLSNPALELQTASQQLSFEQTRFKYQQDLLNIQHQLDTPKANLEGDKILLDGNALAPSTYRQEQQEYEYNLALQKATIA